MALTSTESSTQAEYRSTAPGTEHLNDNGNRWNVWGTWFWWDGNPLVSAAASSIFAGQLSSSNRFFCGLFGDTLVNPGSNIPKARPYARFDKGTDYEGVARSEFRKGWNYFAVGLRNQGTASPREMWIQVNDQPRDYFDGAGSGALSRSMYMRVFAYTAGLGGFRTMPETFSFWNNYNMPEYEVLALAKGEDAQNIGGTNLFMHVELKTGFEELVDQLSITWSDQNSNAQFVNIGERRTIEPEPFSGFFFPDEEGAGATTVVPRSVVHTHAAQRVTALVESNAAPRSTVHLSASERPQAVPNCIVRSTVHTHAVQRPVVGVVSQASVRSTVHTVAAQRPQAVPNCIVRSAVHTHATQRVTALVESNATPRSSVHTHTAQRPTVQQTHKVAPRSTVHAHVAGRVGAPENTDMEVRSCVHAVASQRPQAIPNCTVRSTAHAHASQRPQAVPNCAVRAAIHLHVCERPSLTQDHNVAVRSTVHLHVVSRPEDYNTEPDHGAIELSVGGYCTLAHVEAMLPRAALTNITTVTRANAKGIVKDYFDQINAKLYVLGYDVPVPSSNSTGINRVCHLNMLGAAAETIMRWHAAVNAEDPPLADQLFQQYDEMWDLITRGRVTMGVTQRSTYFPTHKQQKPAYDEESKDEAPRITKYTEF